MPEFEGSEEGWPRLPAPHSNTASKHLESADQRSHYTWCGRPISEAGGLARNGTALEPLAICLRDDSRWRPAPRRAATPERMAGRPELRLLQPDGERRLRD